MNNADVRVRVQSWLARGAAEVARVNRRLRRPAIRRAIYLVALALLIFGLWMSVRSLPGGLDIVDWTYLAYGFFLAGPLMVALNTAETELSARLLGKSFGGSRALRIAVLSSSANMLPLPGGALVRTAALSDLGAKLSTSGAAVAAVGGFSLGIVLVYAGGWLVVLAAPLTGAIFVAAGLAGMVLGTVWLLTLRCPPQVAAAMALVKLAASALAIYALWLPFAALGTHLSLGEISVLSTSSTVGLVVSFVPAGLGVAEAVAAGLAALIEVSPALAFLSATLGRAVWIAFLIPLSIAYTMTGSDAGAKA